MLLVDKRKTGEEVSLTQTFTIPNRTPICYYRLTEVPLRYVNSISHSTGCLKEQISGNPLAGKFVIDYERGSIAFNATDVGKVVTIRYKGTGSVIWAKDINDIKTPRALTRQEIIDLPNDEKEINQQFLVTDYGRIGYWNGEDLVI